MLPIPGLSKGKQEIIDYLDSNGWDKTFDLSNRTVTYSKVINYVICNVFWEQSTNRFWFGKNRCYSRYSKLNKLKDLELFLNGKRKFEF